MTNTAGPLTAGHLMVGNGGVDSTIVASLGTTTTLYHGNVAGVGSFGAVSFNDGRQRDVCPSPTVD